MLPSHHAAALACLRQAGPASSVGASAHTIPDVWQVPVMKTFTLHSQIHAHMSARAHTHTHTHTQTHRSSAGSTASSWPTRPTNESLPLTSTASNAT
jgi:hypothetical protein